MVSSSTFMPPLLHRKFPVRSILALATLLTLGCVEVEQLVAAARDRGEASEGATVALLRSDVDCRGNSPDEEIDLRISTELYRAEGARAPLELLGGTKHRFVEATDLGYGRNLSSLGMDVGWYDGDRAVALIDVDGDMPGGPVALSETREFAYDAVDGCWWEPALDEVGKPAPCHDIAEVILDRISFRRGRSDDDDSSCSVRFDWALWIVQP